MVVMTTPHMQPAQMPGLVVGLLANRSGFQNTSATLWFLLVPDGDAATAGKLKRTNTPYPPSTFNLQLLRCNTEATPVKDNLKICIHDFLKGITSEHHYIRSISDLLHAPHKPAFQNVDCKSADGKLIGENFHWTNHRIEESKQSFVLVMGSKTSPFSDSMEEENDLTEKCKATRDESIGGLCTVEGISRREMASLILTAKNKDDDDEEEDDEEDGDEEDEDDYDEEEDDEGEGGDEEEEDEDGGAGGDDGDADKDAEDDDAEDDEEGDYEEDEDDEDVDEESSSDEDEAPPKKMRK